MQSMASILAEAGHLAVSAGVGQHLTVAPPNSDEKEAQLVSGVVAHSSVPYLFPPHQPKSRQISKKLKLQPLGGECNVPSY